MSQLKVNSIVDASGGSNAQLYGVASPPNSMGFRNRIINGDMRIDQRNAGASVTPTATTYTLDRFRLFIGAASKLSVQQSTDAPAGFSNSTVITVASSYTPSSTEQFFYGTSFEANNIGDFAFGTSSASSAALSFWVKSSVTGTYSFSWTNNANNRSYIGTFAINSANTWEYKTAIIPGDTTGTWDNAGTGRHSFIQIGLGCGSTFESTAGSWQAGNLRQTAGSVDFVSQANGATFYITGVQLEAGTVASPFERRDYGRELMMCQRYYEKSYSISTVPGTATNVGSKASFALFGLTTTTSYIADAVLYRVVKRATPTVTFYDLAGTSGKVTANVAGVSSANNQPVLLGSESNEGTLAVLRDTGGTASNCVLWHFTSSAEL